MIGLLGQYVLNVDRRISQEFWVVFAIQFKPDIIVRKRFDPRSRRYSLE